MDFSGNYRPFVLSVAERSAAQSKHPSMLGPSTSRLRRYAQGERNPEMLSCQPRSKPCAQIRNLLHAYLMRHRVGVPRDRVAALDEIIAAHLAKRVRNRRIEHAVGHEDWRGVVRRA